MLWANLHLFFWLSIFPFVTGWMGENHAATWTVVLYGSVLVMAAVAYLLLVRVLVAGHGTESVLSQAIGSDFKGKISIVISVAGIGLAFITVGLGLALYSAGAVM